MAFLDLLLELRNEGLMNEDDIREEVDTFMFEGELRFSAADLSQVTGHDTTSASMGWTLWCLAHNPEFQEKVIQEVDGIFGTSDRDCTNDDLKQMKYLEKCLKESLRMYPSVPFFGRTVEQDVVISEYLKNIFYSSEISKKIICWEINFLFFIEISIWQKNSKFSEKTFWRVSQIFSKSDFDRKFKFS